MQSPRRLRPIFIHAVNSKQVEAQGISKRSNSRKTERKLLKNAVRVGVRVENWRNLLLFSCNSLKGMAGTTGLEPAASAVTGCLDLEIQALTGSTKERKVLKTRRREFLLFP